MTAEAVADGGSGRCHEIVPSTALLADVLNAHARSSAFTLASGALHLALSWTAEQATFAPRRTPPRALEEMEFEVLEETERSASSAPEAVTPPPRSRARRRSARAVASAEASPASGTAQAPDGDPAPERVAAPSVESGSHQAPSPSSTRTLDLSPRAAANTLGAELGGEPSAVTLSLPDDRDVDRAAERRLAEGIAGLARQGDERLPIDQRGHDLTALVSKPWEVIFRPLRGARYNFHGAGFDAIIRADGSVQYRDKGGLQAAVNQSQGPDGRPLSPTIGLGFLGSLVDKTFGYDPHRSERRRFLERTRPLRELLHERWRRVALARADVLLSSALKRAEIALQAGDDLRVHEQLFALWDECSEDDVGAIARKRIEAFVREHCSPGSEHDFPSAELTALNARRVSRQRFDPFAPEQDAGAPSAVRVDAPDAG